MMNDADSDKAADESFGALFAIFSAPNTRLRSYRTWKVTIRNGEPCFELSEFDRIFEEAMGSGIEAIEMRGCPATIPATGDFLVDPPRHGAVAALASLPMQPPNF